MPLRNITRRIFLSGVLPVKDESKILPLTFFFRKKLPSKPKLPKLPEDKLEDKIEAQVRDIWMRGSGNEVVGEFEKNQCTGTNTKMWKRLPVFMS